VLANRGVIFRPHVVRHVQNSQTNALRSLEVEPAGRIELRPENVEFVADAMVDVLKPGGTAAVAGMGAEYRIAGKTGTAQVIGMKGQKYDETRIHERHRDHALFIAYAPADEPKIALAILVENGGHGGSTAAPIARQVIDFYLLGKEPVVPKPSAQEEEQESD
jgi:penicillin-binding protein 2